MERASASRNARCLEIVETWVRTLRLSGRGTVRGQIAGVRGMTYSAFGWRPDNKWEGSQ